MTFQARLTEGELHIKLEPKATQHTE